MDIIVYEDTKILKSTEFLYYNILYDNFIAFGKILEKTRGFMVDGKRIIKKLNIKINETSYNTTDIIHNIIRMGILYNVQKLFIIY